MIKMRYLPIFLSSNYEEDSWLKILNDIFSLDMGQYENLGFGDFAFRNLRGIIIGMVIGLVLACYLSIFNRRVHGAFVRSLIDEDCSSPEKAKTLEELGYMRNSAVRTALKGGNMYRGLIRCVESEEYYFSRELARGEYEARAAASGEAAAPFESPEFKHDFKVSRFYIPEDRQFTAENRFKKKGTGILSAILITVISIVLLWAILFFLPDILQFLDNFVGKLNQ